MKTFRQFTEQGPFLHANLTATPEQTAKLAKNAKPAQKPFDAREVRARLEANGISTKHIRSQPLAQQHQMLRDLDKDN